MEPDPSLSVALTDVLSCPRCRGRLEDASNGLRCNDCGAVVERGPHGYLGFPASAGGAQEPVGDRLEDYSRRQEAGGERFVEGFLRPYLSSVGVVPGVGRVLDAGCGVGETSALLERSGISAFGVDLPKLTALWRDAARDPERFVSGDGTSLPFGDGAFDVVTAFGVIEHVGTLTGQITLAPDAEEQRAGFAAELARVAKPGGRVLVACPNKAFPLDLHHGPSDDAGPKRPVREAISRWTGVTVHPTWGRQALLSFGEIRRLFAPLTVRPVSAQGFFGFTNVPGWLRGAARAYTERLPEPLWGSAASPFVIAEIRVAGR